MCAFLPTMCTCCPHWETARDRSRLFDTQMIPVRCVLVQCAEHEDLSRSDYTAASVGHIDPLIGVVEACFKREMAGTDKAEDPVSRTLQPSNSLSPPWSN